MAWFSRLFTIFCLTFWVLLMRVSGSGPSSSTPDKPTDLRVTSVYNLKITLTWKRPLNMPPSTMLLYLVRVSSVSSDGDSLALPLQQTESAQLELRDNTLYNIHVKAMRNDDHGKQSQWESLRVNTSHFVPAQPTNLRLVWIRGSTVKVAWDKPTTTASGIPDTSRLEYKVLEKKINGISKYLVFRKPSASLRLLGDSMYEIKVKAFKSFNQRVLGSWSTPLSFKSNASVPSKPPTNVNVESNTRSSISVSWGMIPNNGRNAVILGYIVFYCEQDGTNCLRLDARLNYSLEITDLDPGKGYKVQVAGYNKVGLGTKSKSRPVIVGGRFLTTTQKTTTEKLSTVKTARTTMKTSKITSESVPAPRTDIATNPTGTLNKVETSTIVSSEDPLHLTGAVSIQNPYIPTKQEGKGTSDTPSTSAAAFAAVHQKSESGSLHKIVTIGTPVAGVILVLVLLLAVFVLYRRRSRRKFLQDGGIVPRDINPPDTVTRGTFSVRYVPSDDTSMTQALLDQPVEPHRSLQRQMVEDSTLLGATCPEKCKLSVDLSTGQGKLAEGRDEGLYDSIGDAACKNQREDERYITRGKMGLTSDKAPLEASVVTKEPLCNGAVPAEFNRQGDIYEKMQNSTHVYDTVYPRGKNDPVYENTKVAPSPGEVNRGKEDGYEALGQYDKLFTK